MYVCSCNVITSLEIKRAIAELRTADPMRVLTPGLIYRAIGYRPKCGSCLPHVSKLIAAADELGVELVLEEDYPLARTA
ncbi:(2Fe-2S)-binding protein [Rhodoligotrophos defluvii]|uniref:(2Fe-2S)-binding protein n=1 Tax=Rhodoligotrophos defluvii TaxID=2561934 RepID=UPI0010C9F2B8|nr:(2Fe-2S)-binding protein [Rhodoligotrophos defluvii]